MKIRKYQESDRESLVDITLRAWKPVFEGLSTAISPNIYEVFVPDWQAEQMRTLDTICGSDEIDKNVAVEDDIIVGFAAASYHPEDFLGQVYIVGVDPNHRRKGIATQLTEECLRMIKAKGLDLAMVETGGDPGHAAARATYESMGFENFPVCRYLKRI
ncbi:MAG: GNAT family N-acetyltransferase [Pseudomonadales bacterium]|nr:GNAT family N-acetyltransferase [Pseudomonadales bacterium]